MTAMPSVEWVVAIAAGIGLAAATGFRVFLPFLIAGLAARAGALPLADGFEFLSTPGALVALGTASAVEMVAYFVPGLDHLLDLLAAPVAIIAGAIASASVMTDLPPEVVWPVAILGGGGTAAATKISSALVRAKGGLATAGLANPLVSAVESGGAFVVAVAAIVIPLFCFTVLVMFAVWMLVRRRRLSSRATS